jgi:hypothetical protein
MTQIATTPVHVVRWSALASAAAGIAANTFLVAFYASAKPWLDSPSPPGWYGRANDTLAVVQYLALLPVMLGLGRLMPSDPLARAWTKVGLTAAGSYIVLQVLLLTRILPFGIEVVPATLCVIASVIWAAGISHAGARARILPPWVALTGRMLATALVLGAGLFVVGFAAAIVSGVSWLWVAGGLPGALVFFLLPVWTLLAGLGLPAGRLVPPS